jgi:16S rRNA C1402 (ribose-2'-O) methylase RsmI
VLMLSLTQPSETVIRGTVNEILASIRRDPRKREFVLIVEPLAVDDAPNRSRPRRKKSNRVITIQHRSPQRRGVSRNA